jgi:prepilin-type N-terminal cleavage/methylation domain-containing protein
MFLLKFLLVAGGCKIGSNFLARREAGFTLLEVIVVMALIAVISSVSILSMAYYIPNVRLKSVAQDLDIQTRELAWKQFAEAGPLL